MKKKLLLTSVLIVLALTIIACDRLDIVENNNIEEDIGGDIDVKKDELNIPLTKVKSLDPLENENIDYHSFNKLIYQSLFEFDENYRVVPLLIENYKILEDKKTVELELKENIYWHDDEKLTTEDVAFTIKKLKSIKENSIHGKLLQSALGSFNNLNIDRIINPTIIDDRKMTISFDKIYGNNLEALIFPIVKESSYIGDEFTPIGTGPYKFLTYNSSQGMKLEKNDDYWKEQVKIPKINGKIFESHDLILKAFEDGRVDLAASHKVDFEKYMKKLNVRVLEYISPEYEFLSYNFKNKLLSGENGKKIRKAIYYGVDRQKIIGEIYHGHATQTDTPIFPNSYLTDDLTNFYGYNKEKAISILEDAGFNDFDGDGIVKDSSGRRLSFNLMTNFSNPYRRKVAEFIKEDLKDIGINIVLDYPLVDIEDMDSEKTDKEWEKLNKSISTGNYDLALLGWEMSKVQDLSFIFHSSFIAKGSNINFYNNDKMDFLINDMYFSDRESREDISIELQEYVMEELPYASLYFENRALMLSQNIRGTLRPSFHNLYKGIEKCEIIEMKD